jgi:hypothetical protein
MRGNFEISTVITNIQNFNKKRDTQNNILLPKYQSANFNYPKLFLRKF